MAATRTRFLLLALTLSTAGAVSAAQVLAPPPAGQVGAVASSPAEAPTRLSSVYQQAHSLLGTRITVEGTVMRTTRSADPTGAQLRFLLADARGDTISVQGPTELPAVGAQVIVTGLVELNSSGTPAIGPDQGSLPVTLVRPAAGAPPSDVEQASRPEAAADPCSQSAAVSLQGLSCALASAAPGTMLLAGGLLLLVVAGVVVVRLRRSRDADELASDIALIIDLPSEARVRREEAPFFAPPDLAPFGGAAAGLVREAPRANGSAPRPVREVGEALPRLRKISVPGVVSETTEADPPERPAVAIRGEDVVQMLPGRLEVLRGTDLDPEIRFFRVSTAETPEITFGRAPGPLYRHVQLPAPDVDSMHARLRYQGRHWMLLNLSLSNPVAVNGMALPTTDIGVMLEDGDRIEIGSVAFRYHDGSR